MKFMNITVEGYRSLFDVDIEMRPLMVLIGPNGAGKTTLLDVFRLLRDANEGHVSAHLSDRGGIDYVLTREKAEQLSISVLVEDERWGRLGYAFSIKRFAGSHLIEGETLLFWKSPTSESVKYLWRTADTAKRRDRDEKALVEISEYDVDELLISQVPLPYLSANSFRKALKRIAIYSPLDIGQRSPIRLPQALTPELLPQTDGDGLFSALYNMRARHHESYDKIMDIMHAAFPGFHSLEFPIVAAGRAILNWFDKGAERPFDQTQLSEGTLRFLWLVTALLSPQKPPLLLIDEPEVSLHPELLVLFAEVLKESSEESQVIVATHSDRLIRWLEPERVAVMDKEGDVSTVKWLDSEKLAHWMKDYTLDQLWSMGKLEGRP